MPYVLPALSYAYDALEPHIDARTMEIHHTRHHQTYVNGLNAALEGAGLDSEEPVEQLLRRIPALPPGIHGAVLLASDRLLPHEHFIKGKEGRASRTLRRTWLFVFAIMLHNVPEGLAIGVGYAGSDSLRGAALATGIAIQDVPEGLVVALALLAAGYSRAFSVALGMLSGLVEPLGAIVGAAVVGWSAAMLPWGLGFAAGAMLFVISHEIIPESHRKGHEVPATAGLMLGFVLMMLLDTALG
ncbi:ZIP family metal transporter [Bordetella pertussis]|uniref:ZIP family metal transporter n=1 Tax=Bordetella pertussis TaxID=520 RepID=UPI00320BAF12